MSLPDPTATRLSLHAVAELLLAGPQYAASGTIRLRVTPGGFGTVQEPDLRVQGNVLVVGHDQHVLGGRSVAEVAAEAGLTPRPLNDVYSGGPDHAAADPLTIDPGVAHEIAEALEAGDEAMRRLAPDETPTLWPEHLDVGIALDEVNYGVSPGDDSIPVPYAYVGPWSPRSGTFWNMPFGAARPMSDLGDASGILAFFEEGRRLVSAH